MRPDSNYLVSCGAVLYDQYFVGGHEVPPDSVKSNCLAWLVSRRVPPGPSDQSDASDRASDWRARIAAGEQETVLRECVVALTSHPRSWEALEAQLVLDDLMSDESSFRSLAVEDLASGDFASDLFYYLARGAGDLTTLKLPAATPIDGSRYRSALKALTGITGVNGDRAGDIRALLQKYSYPAPVLRCAAESVLGRMNLWFTKDTPGLDCFVEGSTDLVSEPWQQLAPTVLDTSTGWSTQIDLAPDSSIGFFRLRTSPSAAVSPPWPGAW